MTHASWAQILHDVTVAAPLPAPGEGGPTAPSLFGFDSPIFLILIMVMIFYFLVFMPQRRRDKERRDMLASVKKGDEVVTSGGICGTVLKLTDTRVVIKVNDDPAGKIEFVREAIARVEPKEATKNGGKGKGAAAAHDEDDEEDDK